MPSIDRLSFETLERRMLLASSPFAAAALQGPFGGSVIFVGTLPGGLPAGASGADVTQRTHVLVAIDSQAKNGAIAGHLRIDGLGHYSFSGTLTNRLIFLVFRGRRGAGSLSGKIRSDALRGEVSAHIDHTNVSGSFRVRSTVSGQAAPESAAAPASAAAGAFVQFGDTAIDDTTPLAGMLGGTAHFLGDSVDVTHRRRTHAVLHITAEMANGLLSGSLTLKGVGQFDVTGSLANHRAVLVLSSAGGDASGALILKFPSSAAADFTGQFFATLAAADVHGSVRLHSAAAGGLNPFGGGGRISI